MRDTRLLPRRDGAPPVAVYTPTPGVPPVSVRRFQDVQLPPEGAHAPYGHSHDFLVLGYIEQGSGSLRMDGREWPVQAGDLYLIPPAAVIEVGEDRAGLARTDGWAVYFPAEVLGAESGGTFLAWRAHPLLFAFARGTAGGAHQLTVPLQDRGAWTDRLAVLEHELAHRRDGYRDAVMAHLTLLLVEVARLAGDVVGDLRVNDEPLLAEVFNVIEQRHRDPISLAGVARAVGLTPGHLTTTVRRKTGRTVGEWITERRMAAARSLLVQTDLAISEVGRRSGYPDPAYFARSFRRAHGTTPLRWRRAAGAPEQRDPRTPTRASRSAAACAG